MHDQHLTHSAAQRTDRIAVVVVVVVERTNERPNKLNVHPRFVCSCRKASLFKFKGETEKSAEISSERITGGGRGGRREVFSQYSAVHKMSERQRQQVV